MMSHTARATAFAFATIGLGATGAAALPHGAPIDTSDFKPLVENVQGWRYHARCGWRGGRWVVDLGHGRIVLCRPNRPGRDWVWRNEGPRHGWYHRRDRKWYFNNW